jgi:hypothetical protein
MYPQNGIRRALARSLVLILAAAAPSGGLAAIVVSGPAQAATAVGRPQARPAVPAGLSWHRLKLIHGWRSAHADDDTGNPAWAVRDGIVYLSGSLGQPHGSNAEFAVLPRPARPGHWLWLATSAADVVGGIGIEAKGPMLEGASNEQEFLSLAGISYPAAGTPARKLHLKTGWKLQEPAADVGAPSYSTVGGVVYLSGGLHNRTAGGAFFAVLPKGARPAHVEYIVVPSGGWVPVTLRVERDGRMYLDNGPVKKFVSLAGVSFPVVKSGWHDLTLLNGWQSPQLTYRTGTPSYRVSGGVVYLAGAVDQSAGTDVIAVLPASARPKHTLFISTYTFAGAIGTLLIAPDGSVSVSGNPQSLAQAFTSLAGISFPAGS